LRSRCVYAQVYHRIQSTVSGSDHLTVEICAFSFYFALVPVDTHGVADFFE
jgi:hypothetical protein